MDNDETADRPNIERFETSSSGGIRLFGYRVSAPHKPRAHLLWTHGFAEHSGRYHETLEWFASRGMDSWILDLRGHGRSGGTRVFVERFEDYVYDVAALHREFHSSRVEELPTFAIGHSMGGLVLARYLQECNERTAQLDGAALLSPFLGSAIRIPVWKSATARIISYLFPRLSLPSNIPLEVLSKDPTVGQRYSSDPLILNRGTARWFTETIRAQALAISDARMVDDPILVMHGQADGLAAPDSSREFFETLGSQDKELKLWENLRHELLNEIERGQVRQYLLGWLEARI